MDERKKQLGELLHIEQKQQRIEHIKAAMAEPDFWLHHETAAKMSQELKHLDDIVVEFELAESPAELERLETEAMYQGEHDDASAYVSIHAGSGGTEAQDWAHMLLRMYTRYCEKHDYNVQLLEESKGEEVGIKSATLLVKGFRVYGKLKSESGVHRLVRISPFDADKSRHTSFALVEVTPDIEKTDIQISPADLRIDVYRAGGHGGQGVNTTDSAVRITHIPSKIVVTCQNERSQLQNKLQAMHILESRLQLLEEEKQRAAQQQLKGPQVQASWGNQIRSYVLQPYQLVKDLRTDYETSATNDVLDGDLDAFMDSYARYLAKSRA